MDIIPTPLQGAYVISYSPFQDHRGRFTRLFCAEELRRAGLVKPISQINHSRTSARGALRGLHYQLPPFAETKIITCLRGAVFDVCVDLRRGSPTLLQWFGLELREDDHKAICIPEGFAHGFQTLEPDAELLYLHTAPYTPSHEAAVAYNEPRLGITWPLPPTDLSDRDKSHPPLSPDFPGIML